MIVASQHRSLLRCALFSLTVLALSGPGTAAPAAEESAVEQNRLLGRGVNIIGYDPLWRSADKARFQERHFRLIKEAGFNHVRINLHPFRDRALDEGNRLTKGYLDTLDRVVSQALAQKLLVVLDFHEFQILGKEPASNKERFLATWRHLAEHCKELPSTVLFELLNEPNSKLTPEMWNQYLAEALAIVRRTNLGRTVIIGPGQWNNINALEKLRLPPDDRNLIVTVHYYNPFPFTHQGAPWANLRDKVGITWTGTEQERQAVQKDFDKAQTWAKKNRRPLYLGEFGAYDKADMPSRVRWTSYVTRAAERLGWSWAYWQFDGDFIVFDMKKQGWVEPIRDALIPPTGKGS